MLETAADRFPSSVEPGYRVSREDGRLAIEVAMACDVSRSDGLVVKL